MAKKKVSSAEKAHRQSVKRRLQNRQQRSRLRTGLKAIRAALQQDDVETAKAQLDDTISLVDKMAKKGIIHRNTAGRYKSRIARQLSTKSRTA